MSTSPVSCCWTTAAIRPSASRLSRAGAHGRRWDTAVVSVDDGAQLGTRRRAVVFMAAAGTVAYAALAATTRVNTVPAVIAVAVPGATVAALTLRRPERAIAETPLLRRTTMF